MKKSLHLILIINIFLFLILSIYSCGSGGGDGSEGVGEDEIGYQNNDGISTDNENITKITTPHFSVASAYELTLKERVSDSISTIGKVDWYYFKAVETNKVLLVRCFSDTVRPDIELLVTIYEKDETNGLIRLYADHAAEGAQLPTDLRLSGYIDKPKDIYISVRDLMDDESSDSPYYLYVDYATGIN
ncbi:MAG: hypothetical protein V1872_10545 [bacterium]